MKNWCQVKLENSFAGMEITENDDKLYFCDMEQVKLERYLENQEAANDRWKKDKKVQ